MNKELERKIKSYEDTYKVYLMYGSPKIIRIDLRSGKTYCKDLKKPFDSIFSSCMVETMKKLCSAIPGAKLGYTQSDEISIVIKDINKENQEVAFFKNSLTKIVSNVASMATLVFNLEWETKIKEMCGNRTADDISDDELQELRPYVMNHMKATFDCRYFEVPNIEEIKNYLTWRQDDCNNNSINQIALQYFSPKQLEGVNTETKLQALERIDVKINQVPSRYLKGMVTFRIKEDRNGKEKLVWKDFTAPSFYNNIEFIDNIYNEKIF